MYQKRLDSLRDVLAGPVVVAGLTDAAARPANAHAACDDAIYGAYGTAALPVDAEDGAAVAAPVVKSNQAQPVLRPAHC
jgi:hypothetical protein